MTEALSRRSGALSLERNGQPVSTTGRDRAVFNPDVAALDAGFAVRNTAASGVWATVSVTGVPREILPPTNHGIWAQRRFWTLDGFEPSLVSVKQNDRLVVSINGFAQDGLPHELVINDLLPAGFEIESVVRRDEDGNSSFGFLSDLSETVMREARDDRFIAAVNVGERSDWRRYESRVKFHVAYVIRAITPGAYTLPAVAVEDMYNPSVMMRGEAGRIVIEARE